MKSLTKVPLQRAQIESIIETHFSAPITSLQELDDGMFNVGYAIGIQGREPVFLKVAPPDEVTVLAYEKDLIQSEAQVYRLVQERTSIPIPRLLHLDTSHALVDRNYLITAFIPGTPWNKVAKQVQKTHIEGLKHTLGSYFGQLHQIEGEGFGYPAYLDDPASKDWAPIDWATAFLGMVSMVLTDGKAAKVRLPLGYKAIREIFDSHRWVLEQVTSPRLVHFDLWAGNVLVTVYDGGCHIEGIVDWERAFYGDPIAEFVSNLGIFEEVEDEPEFLEGYQQTFGDALIFNEDIRLRLNLYRAYLLLIMLVEIPYRGYRPKYMAFRAVISKWLGKTLDALRD
jgi:aminoglycoside phosphotransferase (APT) family kinase protein